MTRTVGKLLGLFFVLAAAGMCCGGEKRKAGAGAAERPSWKLGAPIVTYWAGPGFVSTPLRDADARQLREGGWNVVWCHENELDTVVKHGLRGQLYDPLISPASLDNPEKRRTLDALVERVRNHPALYCYFLGDEPGAKNFGAIGRLVAYLREKDPAHLAYVNLFPTGATNEQLGTQGDTVTAYQEYLRRFVETVRPSLLSYDHYQFATGRDTDHYFLNLALMRRRALDSGLPFLNIVQACTWRPSMRAPGETELRYLVYTSLAYGAQGISYYVYSHPGHTPGIATEAGEPTAVYHWLKPLNRDFQAIAAQVQPLRSLGVHHAGMLPPAAELLPADAAYRPEPPVLDQVFEPGQRVRGVAIGTFGRKAGGKPTHALVVNLDYREERTLTLRGPARLQRFDPATGKWTASRQRRLELHLPAGGGVLVRTDR